MVVESTIEGEINGVQTASLEARLQSLNGSALWLPLSEEARHAIGWFEFYAAIGEADGRVKYGAIDLLEFLLRDVPILGTRLAQVAHTDQMVCSAFAAWVYSRAGLLRGVNWSELSPQDLCEMRLFAECVPLVGKPPKIRRFNTV
jgi:hypothetical protein